MKEGLKKNQPVAYKILKNALMNKNYAHAYLFHGEKGTGKLKAAYLLAQSLVCESEGYACEECVNCKRIVENNFADLIVIDGSQNTIKKEDIAHIQEQFTKTALEATGKKIYILNLVENATISALNALLKFLEEPSSDVVAILITEQIDKILPTIISRCQKIPFRRVNAKDCQEYARSIGINELDAYLCAHLVNNMDQIQELSEDENYQNARIWAIDVIEHFYDDPCMSILNIQKEGFNDKNGNDRKEFHYFADILILFFKNVIMNETTCLSETWNQAKKKYTKEQAIQYLKVITNSKDQMMKGINVKLLVDSMLIRMEKEV